MVIVYTTGVFDLLHPGHINILQRAKGLGDRLVVGCQGDESVEKQKGKKPIMCCEDRMAMLQALPLVDVVVPYHDIDQRPMLEMIKPDIVVQGADWHLTADRTEILQYMKENNIKLIQFPYTQGVSSSQIKERVYQDVNVVKKEKMLNFDLSKSLKILPIDYLLTYEDNDPQRTQKVIDSIQKSEKFINPITVGEIGQTNKYLVLDGANRLEAVKQLGARWVVAQVVDYFNPEEVELRGNEHYLDMSHEAFLLLMQETGVVLHEESSQTNENPFQLSQTALCKIESGNTCYFVSKTSSLQTDLDVLNRMVMAYKNKLNLKRKSEVGSLVDKKNISIKFKFFTPSDVVEAAVKGLHFESGITWHLIQNSIIHFGVPISVLLNGFVSVEEAQKYLQAKIEQKLNTSAIRKYLFNVYICDEWE